MSTATRAPAPVTTTTEPAVVVDEPPRPNPIGMIALGLAIVGFVMAIFLWTAGLAWMLLIPAIALGIAGLIIPKRRRGAAIAAVIIGVIGLLLSLVGLRLPAGTIPDQETTFNNGGVNPFSVLFGPLPGQNITGPGTTTPGATGTNDSGLTVSVGSVDCHQPIASVTGLNITGEVCAVTLTATNNGTEIITIDSSNVTAVADGVSILAQVELAEGPVLEAQVNPGESTTGLVYVNVPNGTTDLDGLTVAVNGDSVVNVDLSGVRIGG